MPKKRAAKGQASFAYPPNKYTVAVNLQDAEGPHRVNATVRDSRVNVYGQHVDEIKTKDGEVRYNFHGFSNEFLLPDNVDPNSLTLSMADNQTILIQGDKRNRRRSQSKLNATQQTPRPTQFQNKPQTPSQSLVANKREGRQPEKRQELTPWRGRKDENVQAERKRDNNMITPCQPDNNWVKLKPVSPQRTPCCPLCCGPV